MNLEEINRGIITNFALYIVNKKEGIEKHALAKIMYFAEQKHLAKYGAPISSQDFIAMEYGPVPSTTLDEIKFGKDFRIDGRRVYSTSSFNDEYLSVSAIECIEESFEENINLSFTERTDKSHDNAYNSTRLNSKMSKVKIAEAGGANEYMTSQIEESNQLRSLYGV